MIRRALGSAATAVFAAASLSPATASPVVQPPELYVLDLVNGGKPQKLTEARNYVSWAPAWSPDSQRIAFDTGFSIQIVSLPDGTRRLVGGEYEHAPDWSPVADELAVTSTRTGVEDTYVLDIETSELRLLAETWGSDSQPRWSPDGSRVAFIGDEREGARLWVVDSDGTDLMRISSLAPQSFDWSPDATRFVFSDGEDVYVVDADGSDETKIKDNDDQHGANEPQWSPDGTQIAYGENFGVVVMDADGSEAGYVFEHQGAIFDPQWSPDGGEIAFAADQAVHRVSVETGEDSLVDVPDGWETHPRWAPDGTKLAFLHAPITDGGGSYAGEVTIRYERRSRDFRGAVGAPTKRCQVRRKVEVFRQRREGAVSVGRDVTNDRGNWRVPHRARRGRYYAVVRTKFYSERDAIFECGRDRSVTIRL